MLPVFMGRDGTSFMGYLFDRQNPSQCCAAYSPAILTKRYLIDWMVDFLRKNKI